MTARPDLAEIERLLERQLALADRLERQGRYYMHGEPYAWQDGDVLRKDVSTIRSLLAALEAKRARVAELEEIEREANEAILELQQRLCAQAGVPMPSERPVVEKLRASVAKLEAALRKIALAIPVEMAGASEMMCGTAKAALLWLGMDATSRTIKTRLESLLPCPWCGQDPEIANLDSLGKRWFARCAGDECQTIRLSQDGSREGAVAAWNSRPVPAAEVARTALDLLAERLKMRLDAAIERDGSFDAAVTGRGIAISFLLARELYQALGGLPVPAAESARQQALEEAAKVAESGCLVPPDGGSPTDEEREMCESIAAQIRALSSQPETEGK